jgi:tetratricopeptide (TPR) repeat protein
MRVGITEAVALSWIAKSEKHLSLIYHLRKWMPKRGNLYLRYQLMLHEGIAHARLLKIEKALLCAKQCHKILKKIQNVPQLWRELANLYYHIGRCNDALQIVEKILNRDFGTFNRNDRDFFYADRANLMATSGQYRQCLATLNKIDERKPVFRALILMLRAQCMLGQANIYEAAGYARRAIELAQKNEILTSLHAASLIFAGISAAAGEGTKARAIIRRLNPLFKKSRMEKNVFVREFLSSSNTRRLCMKKYKVEMLSNPVCLLVFLMAKASSTLRLTDYRHVYNYAVTHNLLGLFHRFLLFFPEPVIKILAKGKFSGLPKQYLQLPIYRQDISVYRIDFLGTVQIYCGNRIRKNIPPKDMAFIIYLATAKTKRIPVNVIYQKFWPTSQKPSRNLSHLLVRIRKVLKLATHYINIIQDNLQCECQFITDYEEFETHIAQAKALERIDKWKMAEKVYCQAFLLFREKPFARMYDSFSEEKRLEVIFKFEENARHFIEELKKNGDKQKKISDAVTITLQRITEIAPSLQGCLFESLGYN